MIFRTVSAIAALMICVGALGGRALAQYYPPAQPYPPSQVYSPEGFYPRQGYPPLPPVVDDDADDDMLYDLPDRPLPPEPQANYPRSPAPIAMGDRGVTETFRRATKTTSPRFPERALTTEYPARSHPAQPIRPNRMQFGGRRCGRECRSAPVKSVRDQATHKRSRSKHQIASCRSSASSPQRQRESGCGMIGGRRPNRDIA